MLTPHIALLRGVNVGRGNRVAMADLRAAAEGLGYRAVRTLLNSGNLVFAAEPAPDHAERLERACREQLGLTSRITVLTAEALDAVIADNPFPQEAEAGPSRLLVTFPRVPAALPLLVPDPAIDWSPEKAALGARALYTWHPDGISAGRLAEVPHRAGKDDVTARNWATVLKLQAALAAMA
jgi:uncharacterized protein (DUF1697 family)